MVLFFNEVSLESTASADILHTSVQGRLLVHGERPIEFVPEEKVETPVVDEQFQVPLTVDHEVIRFGEAGAEFEIEIEVAYGECLWIRR